MKYFAFLRAVNVGGGSKVEMKPLIEGLRAAGLEGARSYLNSGNLILDSILDPAAIRGRIEEALAAGFGLRTAVLVADEARLSAAVDRNPFDEATQADRSKALAYFLSKPAADAAYEGIRANPKATEAFYPRGDLLFVYYHDGVGKSAMTTAYIEKALGLVATGRNLNTLAALRDR